MTRTLPQWLDRIERLHPRETELGLERVSAVAERMELLPFPAPVVTVAGTNGKGSTLAFMESLTRAAGKRPGLYTSPHLVRFNERMHVDGREASDEDICAALETVEQARGDTSLTYFEFTTLAALELFRRGGVDMLLLEVGLGGRLDAVNIVDADVAVVTSIGLDHTQWLGDTREAIAAEKVAIMRRGHPILYGEEDMPANVAELVKEGGAELWRAGERFGYRDGRVFWQDGNTRRSVACQPPLGGDNLGTALQALALLGVSVPDERVESIASRLHLPGRAQGKRLDGVDWFLDVGHNREALTRFRERLPPASGRTLAICAMLVDKPARLALEGFVPMVERWYLAGLPGSRGSGPGVLRDALPDSVGARLYDSVAEAVAAARVDAEPGDRVLVFGSFMTVGAAMMELGTSLLEE